MHVVRMVFVDSLGAHMRRFIHAGVQVCQIVAYIVGLSRESLSEGSIALRRSREGGMRIGAALIRFAGAAWFSLLLICPIAAWGFGGW